MTERCDVSHRAGKPPCPRPMYGESLQETVGRPLQNPDERGTWAVARCQGGDIESMAVCILIDLTHGRCTRRIQMD